MILHKKEGISEIGEQGEKWEDWQGYASGSYNVCMVDE